MASKDQIDSLTEDVICPICLDFFSNPVILECGHNFCRSCITLYWESTERDTCPECRAKFADTSVRVNWALGSLSEKARKLNLNPKEKKSKLHCEEHEEELKLFCETDKKLICVICVASREHREHRFLPIKEAVEICKDQMKSFLQSLTKRKSAMEELEQQQTEKISDTRKQSHILQSHITSLFAELRRILTEKEQRLLRDLRDEEERLLNTMEKNLRQIQENLDSLQAEQSYVKGWIDQEDSMILLKEEFNWMNRISDDDSTLSVADNVLDAGKFDNPYLLIELLREKLDSIKRVPVTLDVKTASQELDVSKDRKCVRLYPSAAVHGLAKHLLGLLDTGMRFTVQPCTLGSEGFTSGRHYWEVEVAGNRRWRLGIAAESVERKKEVKLKPKTGFWAIGRSVDSFYAFTSPRSSLPADRIPRRVGVYLSYESGTVSFYNAETKSHLHTFTGNKFMEKLYPFFRTRDEKHWLRICSNFALDP
ncbi:nuclear factor 7, brain-like isoform X2 [Hypanus sabinus]|uniref:nuclear factor 7, brain-like isoform X2 n=1 Tax=Hypanus sabinus TaxID=79690 RepID=UPI0028C42A0A|nr:nuclear factor 7, brain-like isoform X2 [Hypanus sabinus]